MCLRTNAPTPSTVVRAETATILPVGFELDSDGIEGEIEGTGVLPAGEAGPKDMLSGVDSGVPFNSEY